MDLTPHITSVEDSLAAAAAAGDENTARTAAALAAALEPATRLAIMNALAELALEVTGALDDRVVELRLEPGEVRVVVSRGPADADEPAEPLGAGGETSRITLRLPESLKSQADQAAEAAGVSLNTWLTRSVQESLVGRRRPATQQTGHRVRGWVHG